MSVVSSRFHIETTTTSSRAAKYIACRSNKIPARTRKVLKSKRGCSVDKNDFNKDKGRIERGIERLLVSFIVFKR